ncbi:MAG: hypothetical protein RIT27_1160 [Pseudomonadota bacterium]|jgi:hypothetical protein
MNAEELDQLFDQGEEDIIEHLDLTTLQRLAHQHEQVLVDFPEWMLSLLDQEARKKGVTRQSIIRTWLTERLKQEMRLI